MTSTTSHTEAAAELLKNKQFMQLFERSLLGSGGDADGGEERSAAGVLADMPPEGDPRREQWLKNLQKKLQEESTRAAKENLEQVHSDEQGQWMFILPTPGFCIKCTVAGGGKVFINVCQHERIAEPIPMTKEECEGMGDDEVRFRIPLSCGQARPDTDKSGHPCKVYDVIVNPTTLTRCTKDHEFRSFVASLCIHWIKQKYEPTMKADEFRNLNFKAKGQLEPQRIRVSTAPKSTNAMKDEIKLPTSSSTATAPTQVAGMKGSGKLVEEVQPAPSSSVAPAEKKSHVVLASELSTRADSAAGADQAQQQPCVIQVAKEGSYDWAAHPKPSQNVFFREAVPASYLVELHIPTVQTIREVDVRVSSKKLECFYVDEMDSGEPDEGGGASADPFLVVVFDYPVHDEITEAKFVRKTHRLRMRLAVKLPDESTCPRTAPERDAAELEAEEEHRASEQRKREWELHQAAMQRQREDEARVMAERKGYVENLSAVQSGDIPPLIRNEIDEMPKEQLPAMLHRLEGRIMKGDSVDKLISALPSPVLEALIDYIRDRLSLAPRRRATTKTESTPDAPVPSTPARTDEAEDAQNVRVEYNYAAKSEQLFGVAFHNRYLFALDH